MTDEYQGYSNWETWNASLWLSNDEGFYRTVIDIMSQEFEYNHQRFDAVGEYFNELLDEKVITDKISTHRIDWKEVCEGFSEETDKIIKETNDGNK